MRTQDTADGEIAAIATAQHGVIARRQLDELGLAAGAITRRISAGRLIKLHRAVYAVGHARLTLRSRWMAAVLACGPDAVLSHRSAAELWGLRRAGEGSVIEATVIGDRHV